RMTNLDADYDLTLYAPATVPPLVNTGTVGVPLQDPPIPDDGIGLSDLGRQLEPGALQDIPTVDLPIAGQSIFRGTDPEDVSAISPGGGGYYVLQVSGYNDASSPRPYTLRVTTAPPPNIGPCAPRSFSHPTEGSAGIPAVIPANVNTLFLVNKLRLGRTYGAGPANDVLASLATVAGQNALGVAGAVVPVEAYGDNAARYAAWDANPCEPALANAVASGIAATVNSIRLAHPALKYIVFVGGDDQIPFFRVPDLTLIANESGNAATFTANQYYGAFIRENLLSDDPYLDTDPIQAGARQVFVPDLAGGRLVETPGQIIGQLTEFVTAGGILARDSAFSSGYDFASDGTATASAELSGIVGAANTRTLIDDTWNRVGLLGALFPTTGASGINQLNGHYDHHSALPADGNTTGDTSDLITTADLDARPGSLPRRIVFTIGCHAGLPVANVIVGETSPIKRDWAEAYADQRSAYAANTGFGLGSTDSVAWSEQLMVELAGNLNGTLTIGDALAQAKADYFLGRSSFSAYEQKTTLQATLYGLPFFGVGVAPLPVGTPPPTVPPAPVTIPGTTSATAPSEGPIVSDPISGLPSAAFAAVPVFTLENGDFGDFWTNAGQVTGTHYRPLVSALSLPATRTGVRAHSALIESLVSQDDSPWDPSLLMPTTDATALSPEPTFTNIGFPSGIPTMATARSVTGTRSQLNLATSQYFTDDTPGNEGATVMRRWTQIQGRVFYNASTDYEPPTITSSEATRFGTNVGFEVSACTAVRVFILFDDLGDTAGAQDTWIGVDLLPDAPGSCRWTGGAPVIGPNVQYIVQACDADGNCAMSTNKAHYFQAQPEPADPPSGITIDLEGTPAPGLPSYFTGTVLVDVTPADGAAVTIDGRTPASLPASVTSDGLHVVEVDTAAGEHAEKRFVIDATAPQVVITSPAPGATFELGQNVAAAFRCLDSGSGVKSCTGSTANGSPLPTGTVGEKTLTVTATDIVGHTTTATRTYRVVWPFTGFFEPVDNPPIVNVVKAGSSVPVKFGLGGNRGLNIFPPGSPSSVRVNCSSSQPEESLEEIDSPAASGLSYDAGSQRYHYVWRTNKAWAGTCRQLVVTLVDGSSHVASFKFK
ncbi:MAG TPA: PxKF domain-containing protein, partial [Gaiellaceae bacterium]|nr:PxKF domain-containing protein [Gaiellaceae bacterium]